MNATRTYGLVITILGAALLWFTIAANLLQSAPLIMVFGALGAIGAVGLGIWALLGKL